MSTLTAPVRLTVRRFGETGRRDSWWVQPLVVFLGLSTFLVYATWAAFQGDHYTYGPYLSPFYSPEIFGSSPHSWFGPKPAAWPAWLPFSPALLILPIPAFFRFTCYYYRGAYYKAFWADPPSCTVGEPRSSYWGENSFPLILQNIHRYMLFLSVGGAADSARSTCGRRSGSPIRRPARCRSASASARCCSRPTRAARRLPVRLPFHASCRGGCVDELSRAPMGVRAYSCVSCLNRRHMVWAWCSLFTVGFSDLYVRLCSMGVWSDVRIW